MRLVLASASPRRAELLTAAGFTFEISATAVDDTPRAGEAPDKYALRVAEAKASAASARHPEATILAADTVVVAGGQILGKPVDADDARRMLSMLSGAPHDVLTAVFVVGNWQTQSEVVRTRVEFVQLSQSEIDWYVATGEPDGKAGAYAIQGRAARFIERIEGSWSNVVGLPVATVYRMLKGTSASV
jgi:septum formation protein